MRLASIALSSLLVIALTSGRALADDAKLARQHFDDGSKLYDLGKFRDAAREYEEAYKYKPDPALLFNIGQAYRAAGDAEAALTAYRSFLRKVPDAPNRADVEGHIARLQAQVEEQRRAKEREAATVKPTPTPTPTLTPALTPTATATTTSDKPVWKKWWFWTIIGGVVVVGVVVAVAVVATQAPSFGANLPETGPGAHALTAAPAAAPSLAAPVSRLLEVRF